MVSSLLWPSKDDCLISVAMQDYDSCLGFLCDVVVIVWSVKNRKPKKKNCKQKTKKQLWLDGVVCVVP
jgi:hypothetical protein